MKVNITYLKKLVDQLETELKTSEMDTGTALSKEAQEALEHEKLIALNKAGGVCMGIYQEAIMLVSDIHKVVASSFGPPKSSKDDVVETLLGSFNKSFKVNGDKNN